MRILVRASLTTALTGLISGLLLASAQADPPGTPHCARGWHFIPTAAKRTRQAVFDTRRVENRTAHKIQATFTSTNSGTASWSSEGDVGGGLEAVIFSVNATYHVSSTKSITAQTGVSTDVGVPKRRTAVGTYGVFKRPFVGRLQRGDRYSLCKVNRKITVFLPVGSGWRVHNEPL
jgi:hypothetical protein